LAVLDVPWHPLLFGCVPAVLLYAHNTTFVPAQQLVTPILVSVTISAVLWVFATRWLGSSVRAALLVSPTVLLAETYGAFFDFIRANVQPRSATHFVILSVSSLLLLCFLAGCAILLKRLGRRHRLATTTRAANAVALFLISINVGVALFEQRSRPISDARTVAVGCVASTAPAREASVVLLVVDQFASSEEMSEVFGVDNGEFLRWLEERGFRIARKATTRFNYSAASLADLLNMGLPEERVVAWRGTTSGADRVPELQDPALVRSPCEATRDSVVLARFRELGYRTTTIGSWFNCTRYNKFADENINVYGFRLQAELSALVVQASALRPIFAFHSLARSAILRQFEVIAEKAHGSTRKFIFAHVICPHPPYIFDRNGGAPSSSDDRALYRDQHEFVTKKVKELVTRLQSDPSKQPVILIQSDHGSHADRRFDYRVFSAISLPGAVGFPWRDDMPAREVFSLLFAKYFGCQ
jgi:hypothetical protein